MNNETKSLNPYTKADSEKLELVKQRLSKVDLMQYVEELAKGYDLKITNTRKGLYVGVQRIYTKGGYVAD